MRTVLTGFKKSLGQNFLHDRNLARKIAAAGGIRAGDLVLEIGPGGGILTKELLAQGAQVTAVEKDKRLCDFLRKKFFAEIKTGKLVLVRGDILSYKLKAISYKLISNIPYYITGAILKKFLTAWRQPEKMILMLQKEVAERIVAKKQRPLDSARGRESLLSISVKAYGDPKILFRVPRRAFRPAPKVDSAVLEIKNISRARFADADEEKFFKILRAGFAHPRKKLSSNLAHSTTTAQSVRTVLTDWGVENARAEEITLKQWLELAKVL